MAYFALLVSLLFFGVLMVSAFSDMMGFTDGSTTEDARFAFGVSAVLFALQIAGLCTLIR